MRQANNKQQHVNILLVDDYEMFRRGIKITLETLNSNLKCKVTEATSNNNIVDLLSRNNFQLIILDDKLPGINTEELINQIKTKHPSIKILAISVYDDALSMKSIIRSGADGYILKNVDTTQLVHAVRVILKGEKYYSSEVAVKLIEIEKENSRIKSLYEKYGLTQRELEILRLIASEQTNDDISKQLFISKRTVDTHRQNLLHKLQVKNTAGLVLAAIDLKLV